MPVEIITLSLFFTAQIIEGIKYAKDFPTPVPASKMPTRFLLNDSAINFARFICDSLSSKFSDNLANGPP